MLEQGQRGPVVIKWIEMLLEDRRQRILQDRFTREGLVEAYRLLRKALEVVRREGERQNARRRKDG